MSVPKEGRTTPSITRFVQITPDTQGWSSQGLVRSRGPCLGSHYEWKMPTSPSFATLLNVICWKICLFPTKWACQPYWSSPDQMLEEVCCFFVVVVVLYQGSRLYFNVIYSSTTLFNYFGVTLLGILGSGSFIPSTLICSFRILLVMQGAWAFKTNGGIHVSISTKMLSEVQ